MSVSHKDLQVLSNLLLPERVGQQNLESISTLVQNQFGKTDHFKICRVLMFLLHHDFLYDAQSRFTALYIIWDMYKSDPRYLNPFLGFLVSYLQDETISKLPLSAVLVFHTILSQPDQIHEFLKYTPMEILNLRVNNTSRKPDWSALQTELQALNEKLPKVASCGIPCVVPDKDVPSSFYSEESVPIQLRRHCLDSLLSRTEPFSCQDGLRPEFIRVAPPLLPCPQGNGIPRILSKDDVAEDSCSSADNRTVEERQTNVFSGWHEELIWLNPPTIVHDFHWDVGDEQATPITELRTLLNKAMNSTLQQSDQQTIVQMISENPNLVHSLGINVENLPNLVNRNPVIAIEILAVLVDSPKAEEFYDALVSMEVTVDSLEVVNRLATRVSLPKEFIQSYISRCMTYCQSLQDKSTQQRNVRIVCVLIQSFIRNKILDIHNENILIEVQRFCVEFNKVPGANPLYRTIKNMESSTSGTSQSSSGNPTDSPGK
ncbi:CCR4-NOT transcription complex subunit 11 [Clonorchis sinensis]|uniref:CCR4-NOT transcription complex subunit 11 n=2 Tax=Clonorchis sinensis TaxID=79923 RepID=A0A8T1MPW7_CLOSI|nr:CCR4-NOT transcription complex subunit 11 [Clonorchis sinensis]